jgi:CheY-like chemotaxis protein
MKAPLILLFTLDGDFAESVREAVAGTGAVVLIAQDVRDGLQIVSRLGRELDFALMDFDNRGHGQALLSALHTCFEQLPILVATSENAEHQNPVAYANGARACLNKPIPPARIADAISHLTQPHHQPVTA